MLNLSQYFLILSSRNKCFRHCCLYCFRFHCCCLRWRLKMLKLLWFLPLVDQDSILQMLSNVHAGLPLNVESSAQDHQYWILLVSLNNRQYLHKLHHKNVIKIKMIQRKKRFLKKTYTLDEALQRCHHASILVGYPQEHSLMSWSLLYRHYKEHSNNEQEQCQDSVKGTKKGEKSKLELLKFKICKQ